MNQRIEYWAFLLFRAIVLALPLKSAQRLGDIIGRISYLLISGRRRVALENLRQAFSEKSDTELRRIARDAFRNFGIAFAELLWFPNLTDETIRRLVHIKNPEVLERGRNRGKGLILLTGHFGNWELIALSVAYLMQMQCTVIVQTQSNALVDEVINRHRCLFGNKVAPMGVGIREILRTLQNKGVVGIAPDQSGPTEGVYVDFFGRMVATHQGPAVFALRTGASMQMGLMLRQEDGTYEVVIHEVESSDLIDDSDVNVAELTRRHTALLEHYIRMYPDHWLWMHRRWKYTQEEVQVGKIEGVDA